MTPQQFITKWKAAELKERAACQEHFLDLCRVLDVQTPAEADPRGEWYTFEKGVGKEGGGQGFADVWRRGFFGWEYKGKRKNLADAYRQLSQYREALANPPLLIVCDLNRFEIHTNFTGTIKEVHEFDLDGLSEQKNLAKLRAAFTNPDELRPGRTQKQVTEQIAGLFAQLADGMWARKVPTEAAAHFLMKLMFCMFAEDIDLLPRNLFLDTVNAANGDPKRLSKMLADLFDKMATGGHFGRDEILWFNGGLFADADVIDLTREEINLLIRAAEADWSQVEPSIFGTLFERTLDPAKRSQIGAHYTSREDIETLLEPVMMAPLRREWDEVRAKADKLAVKSKPTPKDRKAIEKVIKDFLYRLDHVTVLDPACGSGNFLYVAIHLLLTLEKEVITYATTHDVPVLIPGVRPMQLHGIEINPTAQQLAQVVIWIGFLQWMKFNGFIMPSNPVLDPMESIENRDAILDLSDPENPKEPEWPAAEFIVGNPPFLGGKKLRTELGDEYINALYSVWREQMHGESDLVCYWFRKAMSHIIEGRSRRAGLLSTQGIRGGVNRNVLSHIKNVGDIFFAESDRDWVLDGAAVHVSMIGFDAGHEVTRILDSKSVPSINANLTAAADTTSAIKLAENQDRAFVGSTKKAPLDVSEDIAMRLLTSPNPNGRPSSDVVVPYLNAIDVVRRPTRTWIIDFGSTMTEGESSLYEAPFSHVCQTVKPLRENHREPVQARYWWRLARPCPDVFDAIRKLRRFIVTPIVAKHRVFTWQSLPTNPDHALVVFASSDDYTMGALQSRIHEVWSLAQCTKLEDRPRYTPTTCFETFPFPLPTTLQKETIAEAAKELDTLRNNWLNPPEWTREEVLEFPGGVDGLWKHYVHGPDARGIGTVKYPRLVPKDADAAAKLKKRTLTNLYNERPAWLANAHRKLDEAVFAAYSWSPDISDDELLAKLLALNHERAGVKTTKNKGKGPKASRK